MTPDFLRLECPSRAAAVCLVAGALLLPAPSPASACGGLFCNSATPVNQAAERILFVDHGDGRTTAAIQIQYQGSAERFAWVLPVADIDNPDEDIRVSSDQALERLQQATNPLYRLNTTVEGTCKDETQLTNLRGFGGASGGFAADGGVGTSQDDGGIVVEASGTVGPFDFEFIAVLDGTDDPAQAAIDWLEENEYDLAGGEQLLRPYLEMGNKLLAVRLTSGSDTGSIRPLMVTYNGSKPAIPIRPTAVAAQDDMGVMVFVAGPERAIPKNYRLLELNDALIDWFNPNATYPEVVNRAANESGGHGFVTEYADDAAQLDNVIVGEQERATWASFQLAAPGASSDRELIDDSLQWWNWDGYLDALGAALTLPDGLQASDIRQCPTCYLDGADERVSFDRQAFITVLYEMVVRPMFDTDDLLDAQAYVTRLYTTMSADEMTEDPVFDFNADLGSVSNQHVGEQYIMCSPMHTRAEAPFRVELPSGAVVYGAEQNVWPILLDAADPLPATRTIAQAGTSGEPVVVVDNVDMIEQALAVSNDAQMVGDDSAGCGCRSVGQPATGSPLSALALFPLALMWLRRRSAKS